MKTVDQFMTEDVVTVTSSDTVATAVHHLREHRIEALPVVDDGRLVGIVTVTDLVGHPSYRPVREVMTHPVVTVPRSEPVTTAFALMESHGIGRLPVMDGEAVVGIVTRGDLLQELGKLTDPLTDLPWAGLLRQAAADLLKTGQEIAIIFVDLDEFGAVNKLYGHVVGDRIIRAVAALLQERTDPARDFLSRYAGDEFAVLTTRDLSGAEGLARELRAAIAGITVEGAPPGVIRGSFGIAGGKRSAERADVHFDATVDDLITMASRASTVAKRTERHVVHGAPPPEPPAPAAADALRRVAIRRLHLSVADGRGAAAVELGYEGRVATGRAEGMVRGLGAARLMSEATLAAVRQLLPVAYDLALEDVTRSSLASVEALTIVVAAGSPLRDERLIGSVPFAADVDEAAVKATLKAVNPILGSALAVPA